MASTIVGSVGIRVLPETGSFVPSLQRYLNRVERQVSVSVPINADGDHLNAEVRTAAERASGNTVEVDADVSTAGATSHVRQWVRRMSGQKITVNVDVDSGLASLRRLSSTAARIGVNATKLIGLTAAINHVATAATGAVMALGNMTGALGVLPAVGAAGAAAIGTLVVGMQGFGEAMSNRGDPEAFAESLQKLAPSARAAAIAVRDLGPSFTALRMDVQQRLFAGLGQTIRQVGTAYVPVLRQGMTALAGQMNAAAKSFGDFLTAPQSLRDMGTIFANTSKATQPFVMGLQNIAKTLRDMAAVGSSFLPGLAQGFSNATGRLAAFVAEARKTGKLREWIQGGFDALSQFWQILKNIGASVGAVFGSLNTSGAGFLQTAVRMTAQLRAFLESARGQGMLQSLGRTLATVSEVASNVFGEALRQIGPIIVSLTPAVTQLAQQFGGALVTALKFLGPILQTIAQYLSDNMSWLGPIITTVGTLAVGLYPLAKAFLALRTAITVVKTAFMALRVAFMTNPFGAIITAVIALVTIIVSHWDTIKQYLLTAWNWIKSTAQTVWNAITGAISGPVNRIRSFVVGVWNAIRSATSTAWNAVRNFVVGVWRGIANTARSVWNAVASFFRNLWAGIRAQVTAVWNGIRSFLSGLWNGIASIARSVWNAVRNVIAGAVNGARNTVRSVFNSVRSIVSSVWNAIVGVIRGAWQRISGAVSSGVSAVVGFVRSIPGKVMGVMRGAGRWLLQAGKDLIQGFINGIKNMVGNVVSAVGDIGKSAVNGIKGMLGIGSPSRVMMEIGRWFSEGLGIGIDQAAPDAVRSAEALADNVAVSPQVNASVGAAGTGSTWLADELREALTGLGIEVNAGHLTRWVDRQQLQNTGR